MLERTAATLEPCTFHRTLPTARTRRTLHTGFWQHGAAALDLSLWGPLGRANQDRQEQACARTDSDRLMASAFLLDFLYPRGTVAFLRGLSPGATERKSAPPRRRISAIPRPFTSSSRESSISAAHMNAAHDPPGCDPQLFPTSSLESSTRANGVNIETYTTNQERSQSTLGRRETTTATWGERQLSGSYEDKAIDVQNASGANIHSSSHTIPIQQQIGRLMERPDEKAFDSIWKLWQRLSHEDACVLRPDIIQCFGKSTRTVDAERLVEIFSQIHVNHWQCNLIASAIAAELRLGNVAKALGVYRTSLAEKHIDVGIGHLLSYAFRNSLWSLIHSVTDFYDEASKAVKGHISADKDLAALENTPHLGTKILNFLESLPSPQSVPQEHVPEAITGPRVKSKAAHHPQLGVGRLRSLVKMATRCAIAQPCRPDEALPLLQLLSNRTWYRWYILNAVAPDQKDHMARICRTYRSQPGYKPDTETLHRMFEIFSPNDVAGLEEVYADYQKTARGMDATAFQQFMQFYGSRGDVESTERLQSRYMKKYSRKGVARRPETFNYVLNAYCSRGILEDTRQYFEDMRLKHNIKPDIWSWNILLRACLVANRYDKAIEMFEVLCRSVTPNGVTLGTMATMAGRRGDIDFMLDLYGQAKELGHQANAWVVAGLVSAYCLDGQYSEAEAACLSLAGAHVQGDPADCWNGLLRDHYQKRNIAGVYGVLDMMEEHRVKGNQTTFELLLRSLLSVKQTHQAAMLLRRTIEDRAFPVEERHFAIVMSGALQSRERGLVEALRRDMKRAGFSASMNSMVSIFENKLRKRTGGRGTGKEYASITDTHILGQALVQHYEGVLQAGRKDALLDPEVRAFRLSRSADAGHLQAHVPQISKAITLLARYGDFVSVKQLSELHTKAVTSDTTQQDLLSVPVLNSIMEADVLDGNHKRVKEIWELVWRKALTLGRRPGFNGKDGVLPKLEYILSGPMNSMQRVLTAERDPEALLSLVQKVTGTGFKLSSPVWNYLCRALTEMGSWSVACDICEDKLMPNWTGWKAQRKREPGTPGDLPVWRRQLGNSPQFMRPNTRMLECLMKKYLKLKEEAPWSVDASQQLKRFSERHPLLEVAFNTKVTHKRAPTRNQRAS